MKLLITLLALASFDTTTASATEYSAESLKVASILLNSNVTKCVKQLQKSVYDFSLISISDSSSSEGHVYQFIALAIEGGDIVAGNATITVTETNTSGVFGNPIPVYSCSVSLPTRP